MTRKPFQYSVYIRKIIKVIPHISTEQFIRLHSYRFYGLYVEEKVRKFAFKYCDGKNKYSHPTGKKDVEKNVFLIKKKKNSLPNTYFCLKND